MIKRVAVRDSVGLRQFFTTAVGVVVVFFSSSFALVAQDDTRQSVGASRGDASIGGYTREFELNADSNSASRPTYSDQAASSVLSQNTRARVETPNAVEGSVQYHPELDDSFQNASLPSGVDETNDSPAEATSENLKETTNKDSLGSDNEPLNGFIEKFLGRDGVAMTFKTLLVMAVLTLAPAILMTTTSYVRISVVLSLLRQGLGAGQTPSNQILATIAVFMTCLIMAPVWSRVYTEGVVPYAEGNLTREEALASGVKPIREFFCAQIERTDNGEAIMLFAKYVPDAPVPEYYEDAPLRALAPAFLLSELKTAFLIGFQILLPFLIIDLVVSTVLVSAGMVMTPPAIVSLPFKLALFVMVDGWTLVVKSLLASFA